MKSFGCDLLLIHIRTPRAVFPAPDLNLKVFCQQPAKDRFKCDCYIPEIKQRKPIMKKNVDDFVTTSVTEGYVFYDMQISKKRKK